MLYAEWNWDDALAVRYEEGREEGLEEGQKAAKLKIARSLLSEGATFEFIQKITGLDMETIENL
jgi:predicted transposase/invertase (TIGR01784 family)